MDLNIATTHWIRIKKHMSTKSDIYMLESN